MKQCSCYKYCFVYSAAEIIGWQTLGIAYHDLNKIRPEDNYIFKLI